MAKNKLNLNAAPTFKKEVEIPVAGGKPAFVEFTFKHRTRDDLKDFIEALSGREDVEVLIDIATGWDLDDPFGKESLEKLVQNYTGAARAVIEVYLAEMAGARVKN